MVSLGVRSLPVFTTSFLLPLLLASAPDAARQRAGSAAGDDPVAGTQWAQLTIEQRVIIRIPTAPPGPMRSSVMRDVPPPPQIRWRESKGPKCLALSKIRSANITVASGVTMITGQNELFRTHFGRSCRPADFYAGFYIEPNKDGAICAGRDTLHARNGSTCEIEKFSRLTAEIDDDDEPDRPQRPERPR
jgi:hypothetical protein